MRIRTLMFVSMAILLVTGTALAGNPPTIGVSEFRNDTSAGWWYGGAGNDLAGMLTNELAATDKFKIVERAKLDAVLDEQDLADSGRVSKSTGAKIGKLTGAKYLVFATVSAYEESVKGTGGGLSFRGISVGGKKEDAYLAVDLRVVDTTTGEIAFSKTIEGRSSSTGMSLGVYRGGFGGNLGKYEKTPAGKAIRAAVVYISEYLSCVIVDKDGCEAEYQKQDAARREKTKKSIKLD